jgi:hypothetical protein
VASVERGREGGGGGEEEEAMEAETATRQDSVEPLVGSSLRSSATEVTPLVRGMGDEDEVGQAPRTPRRPPRPPSDGGAARRRSIINAKNERRVRITLSHQVSCVPESTDDAL